MYLTKISFDNCRILPRRTNVALYVIKYLIKIQLSVSLHAHARGNLTKWYKNHKRLEWVFLEPSVSSWSTAYRWNPGDSLPAQSRAFRESKAFYLYMLYVFWMVVLSIFFLSYKKPWKLIAKRLLKGTDKFVLKTSKKRINVPQRNILAKFFFSVSTTKVLTPPQA